MAIRTKSIWAKTDWLIIILYLVLITLGWISIYAAVYNEEHQNIFDMSQRYGKQLLWIAFAILIALMLLAVDSKAFPMFAYIIYIVIILSLISVLLFGKEVHSSRSWFEIGDFRLQPSEFAKFATALALASFMSKHDFILFNIKNIISLAIITLLPTFLILLQPDTGSSLVYLSFVLVLYREGLSGTILFIAVVFTILFILTLLLKMYAIMIIIASFSILFFHLVRRKIKETLFAILILGGLITFIYTINYFLNLNIELHIILAISIIISSIIYFIYSFRKRMYNIFIIIAILLGSLFFTFSVNYIFYNILEEHQQTRINILLGVEEDLQGAGYNVHQSKIAIGSGGLLGKGFLQGTQTKYNFVPEQDTDFIFCTVGEEWGYLGTTIVILLYLALLLRLIFLAERQKSVFSRIYGYCVASILFFHITVNIGMTIGLLPVIGIPLPFFSYGGSSLWSFTILLFIFIKLDTSREEFL